MSADEPPPLRSAPPAEADERCHALEEGLAAARLMPGATERAARLARLEADLLATGGAASVRGVPEPLLAACVRWRAACAGPAPDVRAALSRQIRAGFTAAGAAWREAALDPAVHADPASVMAALQAAARLCAESLRLAVDEDGASAPRPLVDVLPVRAALLAALRTRSPEPPVRAGWVRELVDRAAHARTGIDEWPPRLAAVHLRRTAEEVAWHRDHVEPASGALRRRLARAERRLTAAAQERELDARLADRFGPVRVARWEHLVFTAIVAVIGLLLVEWVFTLPTWGYVGLAIVDTLACGVLLTDFFVRLALVSGRWRWFLRHAWLELLPSLPLSWLALAHAAGEPLHAGVGLRLIQLPRFARTLRVLLPLLRLLRAIGFLVRGVDRMARAYGRFLDRDLILHPTREERRAAARADSASAARVHAIRAAVETEWMTLLATAPPEERAAVARARLAALDGAGSARTGPLVVGARGELVETTTEAQIERWARATPEGVAVSLEPELIRRFARNVRLFARAPLRWTPFVRRYLPRLAPEMSDAEVVAAASRSAAAELGRHHRRWLWFSDLYGTLTPAEFVDRLGTALVRSSFRPAYRLTLFGGFYLVVLLLIEVIGGGFLKWLSEGVLRPLVGPVLLVLGGICFAVLGVGWWMKRTASQATAHFEALTGAQFLELMETVKTRRLERDADLLQRRVLAAEAALTGRSAGGDAARAEALVARVRAWLVGPPADAAAGPSDAEGRVALLYRDALDGGLFLESDARTARQLLGNPVLAALRRRSARVDAAERRALRRLDFDHPTSTVRGPYLWFSFLAQAVVQTVGRLLADYHSAVLPLAELEAASPEERARFETWLASRHAEETAASAGPKAHGAGEHASGDFLALHFLDDDPVRDRDVETRYGPRVLAHLRADRRFLVRRIFGTYPLHLRVRSERVLNLRHAYESWFARGRALLLPFRLAWRALRFVGTLLRWIGRAIREVTRPELRASAEEAAQADFATALRKIDRARGPLADACLWLRARFDAEYLGLAVPGPVERASDPASVAEAARLDGLAAVDADLAFLAGRAELTHRVAEERARARADIARLERLERDGLLARIAARLGGTSDFGPERRRGLLAAYRMDLDGVRTLVSAEDVLAEGVAAASGRALSARCPLFAWRRWRAFRAWWARAGHGGGAERRQAWRVVAHDVLGAGRCLDALARFGAEAARERGEARLAELLRHPVRVTETLVTLRAVQTLSLLDILTYREHVHRVGRYAESGDDAGDRLTLYPEPLPSSSPEPPQAPSPRSPIPRSDAA